MKKGEDRWVSCSADDDWPTSKHRHIVRVGGITTACGATSSGPEIWRANQRKPKCPICVERTGK